MSKSRVSEDLTSILELDKKWAVNKEFKTRISSNQLAKKFKVLIEDPKHKISEILLTNKMGELVSVYPISSDYWQGDEDKFANAAVSKKVTVSSPKWDVSTKSYSFFVSFPLIQNKKVVGVFIAGIDVTKKFLYEMNIEHLLHLEAK